MILLLCFPRLSSSGPGSCTPVSPGSVGRWPSSAVAAAPESIPEYNNTVNTHNIYLISSTMACRNDINSTHNISCNLLNMFFGNMYDDLTKVMGVVPCHALVVGTGEVM